MENRPIITLFYNLLNGKEVIVLKFEYNTAIIDRVKLQKGVKWDIQKKYWYITKDNFKLSEFFTSLKSYCYINYSALKAGYNSITINQKPEMAIKVRVPQSYLNFLD